MAFKYRAISPSAIGCKLELLSDVVRSDKRISPFSLTTFVHHEAEFLACLDSLRTFFFVEVEVDDFAKNGSDRCFD